MINLSTFHGNGFRKSIIALTTGVAIAVGLATLSNVPALADGGDIPVHFFVSKNGDNSDGKSWATAWNEMNQIQWNQIFVYRGDDLTIDGGTTSMTYTTPMTANPPSAPYPLNVLVSTQPGHSGLVVISGNGQNAAGIKVLSGIFLDGMHTGGLVVTGWTDGVDIAQGAHTYVQHVDMVRNRRGLHMHGGFNNVVRKCTIHDNGLNALVDPTGPIMSSVNTCWIYNSSYLFSSDGIRLGDGTNWTSTFISNCVIGPGLQTGFRSEGATQFAENLSDCLLINASRANISSVKGLQANRVTSFMTKLNPFGRAHACVSVAAGSSYPPNSDLIMNSIFYGGIVKVAPNTPFNIQNNTQYRVTGNTTLLAPTQVDPQFMTNVGLFPDNVSIKKLIQADYSLQPGSPAQGTGSSVTSVRQLLGLF